MNAVTGLSITIGDGMEITLSAADWTAEGHLFAIERMPVTVEQLFAVARCLGPDVVAGVGARLDAEIVRAQGTAKSLLARVEAAEVASRRFDHLTKIRRGLARQ